MCLFFTACEQQKQTEMITPAVQVPAVQVNEKPDVSHIGSENNTTKVIQKKPLPTLNLSIDNLSIENENTEKNFFKGAENPVERHSQTFNTLSKEAAKSNTHISGNILTNSEKLDNKEYINSLDGVQINIKGNF